MESTKTHASRGVMGMDKETIEDLVKLLDRAGHEDAEGFVTVTLMSEAAAQGLTLRQALNSYANNKRKLDAEELRIMISQIEPSLALLSIDEVITAVPY